MTMTERWLDVLCAIPAPAPVNIDAIIEAEMPGTATTGSAMSFAEGCLPPPSARLWRWDEAGYSCIGIRIMHSFPDSTLVALRLAAAAVERNVIPIILTRLPSSGFERFGFRTERLSGSTPEALADCEAELARYWNMAIVIDAEDVALLG